MRSERSAAGVTGDRRRPWADLCPDLLNSICSRLPSHIERAEFGSVCRNWRRFYTATTDYAAPRATHNADLSVCTFYSGTLDDRKMTTVSQPQHPDQLARDFDGASVIGKGSGWWLLCNTADEIFCCFNPLLPSGNVIEVPRLFLSLNGRNPRRAALSAPPTDPDSVIFVLHGGYQIFSLLFPHENRWWTCRSPWGGRISAEIGYKEGRFFCLLETGDVLVVGREEEHGERRWRARKMRAARPLSPKRFHGINYLRSILVPPAAAAAGGGGGDVVGEFQVLSWERASRGGSFRLLTVERESMSMRNFCCSDDETTLLEAGVGSWEEMVAVEVEDQFEIEMTTPAGNAAEYRRARIVLTLGALFVFLLNGGIFLFFMFYNYPLVVENVLDKLSNFFF